MINSCTHFKYRVSEFERSCILLIEEELNVFFSACLRSAEIYSVMAAGKPSLHDKKIFEELVISPEAVENLIKNIMLKINKELKKDVGYIQLNYESTDLFHISSNYNDFIDNTVRAFRTTQVVTKASEKIIDSVISYMFDRICPDTIINNLLKKIISGKKILGNNNLENQIERHGKLIYRQIEGFLINVKTNLRNGLIKVLTTLINSVEKSVSIA
ncbi:hypothetical protein ACJDU8_21865 [Clostridium sp. WILCCON 0269]|uniref:Uncharacterized protein n=1 Tax=Candidatus Clostridium eludens TaxID=3381663 RepID=A0ABW8SSS8_9CLOT